MNGIRSNWQLTHIAHWASPDESLKSAKWGPLILATFHTKPPTTDNPSKIYGPISSIQARAWGWGWGWDNVPFLSLYPILTGCHTPTFEHTPVHSTPIVHAHHYDCYIPRCNHRHCQLACLINRFLEIKLKILSHWGTGVDTYHFCSILSTERSKIQQSTEGRTTFNQGGNVTHKRFYWVSRDLQFQ